ncbi:E3 ubiquitin-protein ligase Topors-like isoform X2 [Diabrotica virgifera virgifera]|uniref:RING-type E3 ubiquitin transferase n=1 Tax=Diabrotica virgifera virgifera TaxID=50390 RepID=A0ABM5JP76_DIAVI|nr:E3 ubiquitin-protein ligase Topors-like isoform X2 [Diabrotica virgifera virgifera]
MAESRLLIKRPSSSSPPPNCAICLGSFSNKCVSDTCLHQFCFKCLLEWSKIKAECPLCKQPFTRILHNIKNNGEYDEHVVDILANDLTAEEIHVEEIREYNTFLPNALPPTRHHFHFRTTFTVDTHGEHAIQQMLLTHPQISVSTSGYPERHSAYHRRRREIPRREMPRREIPTTTAFRRSVYTRNLWAIAPPDVDGNFMACTPEYFRQAPLTRNRLVPWLNRELNALLYDNTQLVMRLVDTILDMLLQRHICSRTFRNVLLEHLNIRTDHFIHEFFSFMKSRFDMIGYDRQVIYSERPLSPLSVVTLPDDVSDSGHDSDVIIVGSTGPQEPVVIDLLNTDSDDEPILVSHEEPPPPELIPISDSSPEAPPRDNRSPVLPLKLRLKHKRRSREEERYRKRFRRYRSSSCSSSSDSSVRRSVGFRRKRKQRKPKRRVPSSSESVATASSDSKRKQRKPRRVASSSESVDSSSDSSDSCSHSRRIYKKLLSSFKRNSKTAAKERTEQKPESDNKFHNLPSCSRDSGPSSSIDFINSSNLLDLRTNVKREPSAAVELATPDSSGPNERGSFVIKTLKKEPNSNNLLDLRTIFKREPAIDLAMPSCSVASEETEFIPDQNTRDHHYLLRKMRKEPHETLLKRPHMKYD